MDYLQYFAMSKIKIHNILFSFKPYYKWITFNTVLQIIMPLIVFSFVLNLIINGLPSILNLSKHSTLEHVRFSVLNLIINGLPSILRLEHCSF